MLVYIYSQLPSETLMNLLLQSIRLSICSRYFVPINRRTLLTGIFPKQYLLYHVYVPGDLDQIKRS